MYNININKSDSLFICEYTCEFYWNLKHPCKVNPNFFIVKINPMAHIYLDIC